MKRSYKTELMDNTKINSLDVQRALNELKIINKYLGGIAVTRNALQYFIRENDYKLVMLDSGSGSSDILTEVKNIFSTIQIISLDININALKYAEKTFEKINADIFKLPLTDNSVDIVHASLFLHHFNEIQIRSLLNNFLKISRKGIIINDLHRSVFALAGIKLLTALFSKSYLVKNDAPLSVRKGFKKSELQKILSDAGIKNYLIKNKWAFRWMIIIRK